MLDQVLVRVIHRLGEYDPSTFLIAAIEACFDQYLATIDVTNDVVTVGTAGESLWGGLLLRGTDGEHARRPRFQRRGWLGNNLPNQFFSCGRLFLLGQRIRHDHANLLAGLRLP